MCKLSGLQLTTPTSGTEVKVKLSHVFALFAI